MHERLIRELRFSGNEFKDLLRMGHICEIMLQAADVIEGLERENEKLHADIGDVRPVVKAKWAYTDMSRLVCSNCGNPVAFSLKEDGWHHGDFCPNCGAKMEES